MKKISTIFLLATIIACFLIGVPTFANEVDGNDPEPVGEEYAGISNLSFNLSISNAGNATIHFTLGVTSGYSADYELILLRDNTGTWDEYSSWSGTLTGFRSPNHQPMLVSVKRQLLYLAHMDASFRHGSIVMAAGKDVECVK